MSKNLLSGALLGSTELPKYVMFDDMTLEMMTPVASAGL